MSYLFKTTSEHSHQNTAPSEALQQKIDDVREQLGELTSVMPSFLSNGTICRFLRARNWSTEQATKALKDAVEWRRRYKPDEICLEDIAGWENEARRAYLADYEDKQGRCVFVTMTSLKSTTSARERRKLLVYNLENMAMILEETQQDGFVWMCDFQGWTLSSMPLLETRESLHIIQSYYPGLIASVILNDPPRIFESFWKLIKHVIEPALREKVKFVYSHNPESKKIMAAMFDLDKVESAFGGRDTVGLDITKCTEKMRRRDQMRGAWTPGNGKTSSSRP